MPQLHPHSSLRLSQSGPAYCEYMHFDASAHKIASITAQGLMGIVRFKKESGGGCLALSNHSQQKNKTSLLVTTFGCQNLLLLLYHPDMPQKHNKYYTVGHQLFLNELMNFCHKLNNFGKPPRLW